MRKITLSITPELCAQLGITDSANDDAIGAAIVATAKKAAKVDAIQGQLDAATTAKGTAEAALVTFKTDLSKKENKELLDKAVTDKKITVEVRDQFEKDYAANTEGLKTVLTAMGAYTSVVDQIAAKSGVLPAKFANKSWDELYEANLLVELKAKHFDFYKQLWEEEHKETYTQKA